MNTLLKDIWYGRECPIETPLLTEEMRDIEKLISRHKDKLSENISKDLQETLEKYDQCVTELISISEQAAFIKGVRFASRFFIEALAET